MSQTKKRQSEAIKALLEADSISAAAEQAGVCRRTLYRWLDDPGFQAALREARKRPYVVAMSRLCQLANKAVTVLSRALDGEPVTKNAFLAARAVLEFAGTVRADDLEARLAQIEERIAGVTNAASATAR